MNWATGATVALSALLYMVLSFLTIYFVLAFHRAKWGMNRALPRALVVISFSNVLAVLVFFCFTIATVVALMVGGAS